MEVLQEKVNGLEEQVKSLREHVANLRAERDREIEEKRILMGEMKELRVENKNLREKNRKLRDELKELKENRTNSEHSNCAGNTDLKKQGDEEITEKEEMSKEDDRQNTGLDCQSRVPEEKRAEYNSALEVIAAKVRGTRDGVEALLRGGIIWKEQGFLFSHSCSGPWCLKLFYCITDEAMIQTRKTLEKRGPQH